MLPWLLSAAIEQNRNQLSTSSDRCVLEENRTHIHANTCPAKEEIAALYDQAQYVSIFLLVDAAVGHKVISFIDCNAGYNQIFMAEEDIAKIAFRCPGAIGLFEWVVMTIGLKNAGATYKRAMNYIFYKLIDRIVEI